MSNMWTTKQSEYIKTIDEFMLKNYRRPSVREVCKLMNVSSTSTVSRMINKLEKRGYNFTPKAQIERKKIEVEKAIKNAIGELEKTLKGLNGDK